MPAPSALSHGDGALGAGAERERERERSFINNHKVTEGR
jgi:hypothetical protein